MLATVSSWRETRRTVSASSMDGLKNSSVIAKSCSAYQGLPRNTTSSRGGTPVSQVGRYNYPIEVTLIGGNAAAMHHNETLARRIVAEVDHVTAGRPMRWPSWSLPLRLRPYQPAPSLSALLMAIRSGSMALPIGFGASTLPRRATCALTDGQQDRLRLSICAPSFATAKFRANLGPSIATAAQSRSATPMAVT
jgi:hypothetical protein